jgi:hypothetical protein
MFAAPHVTLPTNVQYMCNEYYSKWSDTARYEVFFIIII